MGLFAKFFSSKKGDPAPDQHAAADLAKRIQERLLAQTGQPALAFSVTEDNCGLFESKLGGAYYVPADQPCPTNSAGQELYLLAQLNFDELPHLADFPQRGLLQIFLDGHGDVYGIDFDDPTAQTDWCIRFLPAFPAVSDVSPELIHRPAWSEDISLPLMREGTYRLTAAPISQAITTADWRISDAMQAHCRDLLPDDFQSVYDLDDDVFDAWNELSELIPCQIGGYPFFTQYDPREGIDEAPELLLFQLDTSGDVMWGDSGVGNFFIRREDLKNLDFSKVWYNWDCY